MACLLPVLPEVTAREEAGDGVAREVVTAWIITIPSSAAVGALFYGLTTLF